MCIYVQSPLTDPLTYFVHPRPASWATQVQGDKTLVRPVNSATFRDFAYSHIEAPGYNQATANVVQNGIYAQNGPHPSDMVVASDNGESVYMDQVFVVATSNTAATESTFAKTPEVGPYAAEYAKRGFSGHGNGQMFGYATCHWIRACDSNTETVGTPCQATLSNVLYSGFCFKSDTNTLECGHLTAMDDEYGERPVAFDDASPYTHIRDKIVSGGPQNVMPAQTGIVATGGTARLTLPSSPGQGNPYRCPTGSPAKSLGYFVSKRMKIAGCMNETDANYDQLAEVHVPDYCATPGDFNKGCLMPAAVNFDPHAKQSGTCHYATVGCRSPTALNYNSLATVADPQNFACIEFVSGCTVNSLPDRTLTMSGSTSQYKIVALDTPGVNSGTYASGAAGGSGLAGIQANPNGPVVTNYNPAATVLDGSCIVAVEGCMDSTARNYDPLATVQTGTWCVPLVTGCMMPAGSLANSHLAANYNPSATLNVPSTCQVYREGCMSSTALNYEPTATISTTCYEPKFGCLHPNALNFGCSVPEAEALCLEDPPVTQHLLLACNWIAAPGLPPPPPAPPFIPGMYETVYEVVVTMAVAAKGSDYTADEQRGIKAAFAAAANVDAPAVTLVILYNQPAASAGRRLSDAVVDIFQANIRVPDAAAAEAATTAISQNMGTAAAAQALLLSVGGVTVEVLSTPTVETVVTTVLLAIPTPPIPPPPATSNAGAIIGIVVGVLIGLMLIVGGVVFYKKRQAKKGVYPA